MNFENWISLRYLTASKGRFLSFLHIISITGFAIGVTAIIVVIAVMTGFGNNLRDKIIGTTPHIMAEKETTIRDFEALTARLATLERVEGVSAYIQGNIFIEESGRAIGIAIRGIDPIKEERVTKISQYLVEGVLMKQCVLS